MEGKIPASCTQEAPIWAILRGVANEHITEIPPQQHFWRLLKSQQLKTEQNSSLARSCSLLVMSLELKCCPAVGNISGKKLNSVFQTWRWPGQHAWGFLGEDLGSSCTWRLWKVLDDFNFQKVLCSTGFPLAPYVNITASWPVSGLYSATTCIRLESSSTSLQPQGLLPWVLEMSVAGECYIKNKLLQVHNHCLSHAGIAYMRIYHKWWRNGQICSWSDQLESTQHSARSTL